MTKLQEGAESRSSSVQIEGHFAEGVPFETKLDFSRKYLGTLIEDAETQITRHEVLIDVYERTGDTGVEVVQVLKFNEVNEGRLNLDLRCLIVNIELANPNDIKATLNEFLTIVGEPLFEGELSIGTGSGVVTSMLNNNDFIGRLNAKLADPKVAERFNEFYARTSKESRQNNRKHNLAVYRSKVEQYQNLLTRINNGEITPENIDTIVPSVLPKSFQGTPTGNDIFVY